MEEVRTAFGPGAARLAVALLPDLAQVRRILLPPLSDQERRDVLRRALGRHFLQGHLPHAFGVEAGPQGVVAAAAPLALVEALEHAAAAAGWRLSTIVPAEAAWAAAGATAVALPDRVEVLRVDRGRLIAVRRTPRRLFQPEQDAPGLLERPEEAAAEFAHRARGPEIVTDATWSRRRRTLRRASQAMAAAASIVLLLAGAVEWWGAKREVAGLRGERARHAVAVARALGERERVVTLEARHDVLWPGAGGVRWSRVLAQVTEHLPRTAYLTAFRAAGDSLALEGVAREAGPVLDSLRAAPPIAGLRATAPIRREGSGRGGEPIERFALAARLAGSREPQ